MTGRRGFTLAELLVALALLATVLAIAASAATMQWRSDAALDARRTVHAQLAAGAQAMAATLRAAAGDALALDSSDLALVSDTLVELRAPIAASVVCAVVDPYTIDLPAESTIDPALTWRSTIPIAGDVLLVDSAAALPSGSADGWGTRTIASVAQPTRACAGTPFDRAAESALPRLRVRTSDPLPATLAAGAVVRIARRVRWVHYRASDGRWYLGQREWNGGVWTTTQPVAGPLRAPGPRGGLTVRARDTLGMPVASARIAGASVATLDLVLRADAPTLGRRGAMGIDSIAVRAALRNGTRGP